MTHVLSHIQLFVTPWTVTHQLLLSMDFSKQEHWSGLSFPPPGDLPNPGIELGSLESPALAGGFFATSATMQMRSFLKVVWLYGVLVLAGGGLFFFSAVACGM